ncbi:MAG: hypothetical protein MHM6MM_001513 [Cercozoa sp. M6MM]
MSSKPLYKFVEHVKAFGRGVDRVGQTALRVAPVDKLVGAGRHTSALNMFKMDNHEPWEGGLISWGPLKIVERIYRSPIGRLLPRTKGGWPVAGLTNPLPYRMHYLDSRVDDEDGLYSDHVARPLRELVEVLWDSDVDEIRNYARLVLPMINADVDETTIAAYTDELLSIKTELQQERDELVELSDWTNAMIHMSPESRERATWRLARLFQELVSKNKVQSDFMINQHDLEQRMDDFNKKRIMMADLDQEHPGPVRARHLNVRRWMTRQSTTLKSQQSLGLPVRAGGGHAMRAVNKVDLAAPQLAEEIEIGMLEDEAASIADLHPLSGTAQDVWHVGGKRETAQRDEAAMQQRQQTLYEMYQRGEIDTPYPKPLHLREQEIKERQLLSLEQLVHSKQQPTA